MVDKFLSRGKKLFTKPQTSILSAATIIMLMIVASRVLGLVRQRTLAHFFTPNELSLFFAAFRLPDFIFEILVFGTFSSAFIPVFTKVLAESRSRAWDIARTVTNISLLIFVILAGILAIFAGPLYNIFAPGYTDNEIGTIAELARVLFISQGFFVLSYVLTGVLESSRRFLVPALSPLFYNLGIIFGTILFSPSLGLWGPVLGVFVGAFLHFLIQIPLSFRLGYRFAPTIDINEDVKRIGKLALPRIVEVLFLQISKTVELYLASLISTAAYTYYTFGSTLQLLPVGLFGTSIAKAALPTLTRLSQKEEEFKKTLMRALYQMVFLTAPVATTLIVLRIPTVRLVYGTDIFSWEATVQTGMVVSAFALGIIFQVVASLLSRGFYALHDTKTPVIISVTSILINIFFALIFINRLGLDVWGLALAFSIGAFIHAGLLFYFMNKKLGDGSLFSMLTPVLRSIFASLGSGAVMYFLLKIFDRSVWVKRLSFLGKIEGVANLPFESFVLDTRYTANLLVLTVFVALVGGGVYLILSAVFGSTEIWDFVSLAKRVFLGHKVARIPEKETESITPPPTDSPAS